MDAIFGFLDARVHVVDDVGSPAHPFQHADFPSTNAEIILVIHEHSLESVSGVLVVVTDADAALTTGSAQWSRLDEEDESESSLGDELFHDDALLPDVHLSPDPFSMLLLLRGSGRRMGYAEDSLHGSCSIRH